MATPSRKLYCVMCGAIDNGLNGLDTCPKSEYDCSHLWAIVGFVKDWFPQKRVYGKGGAIRRA